ncbi:TlpA family protein disulfide reductase [Mesonia maritima]|uniref:Thiol-disulfide isomerase/thioredoxin n=1 Tax=Mesonia maritima TaxID=1793873 RepID=A0ABU1K5M2_9FLAO|nr:TlpA disulfide reductase family protein [Mesonia maritima]MDR6300915.1 thiol-disulfide isomerase/thioredoxin [Mesonia maritima]
MRKLLPIFTFLCIAFSITAQENIPNVDLKNLNGNEINAKELSEDKLVVISLWATWCVPCLKELDAISYVYEDWQEETGVELYAVSVDDARTVKRVRPLISGKGWNYHILLDTNNDFKRALGASSVPLTLLVKNNKVVYRHSGYSPGAEDELYEKIKEYAK